MLNKFMQCKIVITDKFLIDVFRVFLGSHIVA